MIEIGVLIDDLIAEEEGEEGFKEGREVVVDLLILFLSSPPTATIFPFTTALFLLLSAVLDVVDLLRDIKLFSLIAVFFIVEEFELLLLLVIIEFEIELRLLVIAVEVVVVGVITDFISEGNLRNVLTGDGILVGRLELIC